MMRLLPVTRRGVILFVLTVFTFFVFAADVSADVSAEDGTPATRVHILILPNEVVPALDSLAATISRTTALDLRSRGTDVTELQRDEWGRAADYLATQEPGSFDRLVTISLHRSEAGLVAHAEIIDPLSGEVLLSLEETASRPIGLFQLADTIAANIYTQVTGIRVAFGTVAISVGEWVDGFLSEISWDKVAWAVPAALNDSVINQAPTISDQTFEVTVGGEVRALSDDTTFSIPIGTVPITITHERGAENEILYQGTVEVMEDERTAVTADVPLVSEGEREQLRRLIDAVQAARQTAEEKRDESSYQAWIGSYGALRDYTASLQSHGLPLGMATAHIDHATVGAKVDVVRMRTETTWQSPAMEDVTALVGLANTARGTGSSLSDDTVTALMIERSATELAEDIIQLAELELLRETGRREWKEFDADLRTLRKSVEDTTYPVPPWLEIDIRNVEEIFERYESEDPGRYGLYGTLSLGGTALMITGATLWTSGVWTALQYQRDREDPDYGSAFAMSLSLSEMQSTRGGTARLLGAGSAALGLTGFLLSPMIQTYDRVTRADMLLRTRLKAYFEPRMEVDDALRRSRSRRDNTISLPISEFE